MYTIDNAKPSMLRNYAEYVEGKIDINEIPLDFEQWQENEPQVQIKTDTEAPGTICEQKKARFFELFEIFYQAFDNDINSGLEDGTYEEKDNVENLALIDEAETLLEEMKEYTPEIYLYIEGGNLQGISGTEGIAVEKFDKDDYDQSWQEDGTNNYDYTPEQWDEMITKLEAEKKIKGIH